jgi:hypothetical protein
VTNLISRTAAAAMTVLATGALAAMAQAQVPEECRSKPLARADNRQIAAQASRMLPPDWREETLSRSDWLPNGGGKYRMSKTPFSNAPGFEAAYPVSIFLDFDHTVYWNGEAAEFSCLKRLAGGARGKSLAVAWHRLTPRGLAYEAIWALNDAGVTPVVVIWRPVPKVRRGDPLSGWPY